MSCLQINASTDYAIRLLLCLAKASVPIPSSKLAAAIGVSSRYLLQIGARLRDEGFIAAAHGSTGGFSLKLPPTEIELYDVIDVMERKPHKKHSSGSERFRNLEAAYTYIDTVLHDILKNISIESLL